VGLGKTGYSCVRYLLSKGHLVSVMDSNPKPGLADALQGEFPQINCSFGSLNEDWLLSADEIVISPGVPLKTPEIHSAKEAGKPIIGDIDLFLREFDGDVIAITGSNGKSTVTSLVGEMALMQGLKASVGGNIGVPVLDLLDQKLDQIVLELSSFQLETIHELKGHIATVLNVSEDHMDRYDSMEHYVNTKHAIFKYAKTIVSNQNDVLTHSLQSRDIKSIFYSLNQKLVDGFYLEPLAGGDNGVFWNGDLWLKQSELRIKGKHNLANVLTALSIGTASGYKKPLMIQAIKDFSGLVHRCQWVRTLNGVDYINDSKATNVGAAVAAMEGLGNSDSKNIHLIAGGVGKNADFSSMAESIGNYCRSLTLIGQCAGELYDLYHSQVACFKADSMKHAVHHARELAHSDEIILLAPACASFDMYSGFEQRGDDFVSIVEALV